MNFHPRIQHSPKEKRIWKRRTVALTVPDPPEIVQMVPQPQSPRIKREPCLEVDLKSLFVPHKRVCYISDILGGCKFQRGLESSEVVEISRLSGSKKLAADLKDMFLNQKCCDATLKVKDEEFLVHKFILQCRCPVFASMFGHEMEERKTGVVNIVDCDPEAFRDFLLFLYSGECENLSNNVFELYKIADKYDVQELKLDCVSFILRNFSCENVFDAVILARTYDEDEMKHKAQNYFDKHFRKIAYTEKWHSFLKESPSEAFEMLKSMLDNRSNILVQ